MATLDAVSNGSVIGGTSLTFAHTTNGTNRILVVGVTNNPNAGSISGVTYDGVPMTLIASKAESNSGTSLFYLLAPHAGAHDIVISASASIVIFAEGASFNGVGPTQTDASVTNSAIITTSVDNTLTTVADHALHVAVFATDTDAVSSFVGGTAVNVFMAYNLDITPAASHTITANSNLNNTWATVGASFKPGTQSGGLNLTSKTW